MTGVNGGVSAVDQAVYKAYADEGYIQPDSDGKRDLTKVCERIFTTVSQKKVLGKGERGDKATRRGDLVAAVFPSLPGPDQYEEDALAEAVYGRVASDVWALTHPRADGRVQRLVGMNMGNGYVLCRTKVGPDRVDAVYITDVMECIRLDYTQPDNKALNRRIETSTHNREMLVIRQPHNAKAYASEYDRTLKNALSAAHSTVMLTVESVTVDDADDADDDE